MTSSWHVLRVAQVDRIATDAAVITFDVPDELRGTFTARPGQWVGVRRVVGGQVERRSYSVCSQPGEPLRIGVRELGDFSAWLVRGVRRGYGLEVDVPQGTFGDEAEDCRTILAVAAGSGITPILPIVASRLRDPGTRVRLVCVDRVPSSAMFTSELDDLAARHAGRFELVRVWTRDSGGGRPDAAGWLELVGDADPEGVWLCGPQGLVDRVRTALADHRIIGDRIHVELFDADRDDTAPAAVGAATGFRVDVLCSRISSVAFVPAGEWLLDGLLTERDDIPFSCMSGTCGSCRALLRTGRVDMAGQQALTRKEVRRGYVLTCVSKPLTDVDLDFDS